MCTIGYLYGLHLETAGFILLNCAKIFVLFCFEQRKRYYSLHPYGSNWPPRHVPWIGKKKIMQLTNPSWQRAKPKWRHAPTLERGPLGVRLSNGTWPLFLPPFSVTWHSWRQPHKVVRNFQKQTKKNCLLCERFRNYFCNIIHIYEKKILCILNRGKKRYVLLNMYLSMLDLFSWSQRCINHSV